MPCAGATTCAHKCVCVFVHTHSGITGVLRRPMHGGTYAPLSMSKHISCSTHSKTSVRTPPHAT